MTLRHPSIGLVALAALMPAIGFAQQATAVTDQDIERVRSQIQQQQKALTDEKIEEVRKRVIVPQQERLTDQAIKAARPKPPNLDALPQVQSQPNVDVGALAGQFLSQMKPTAPGSLVATPKLYVFITMAMSTESLKALVAQAEKAQATLVLRGLVNNSFKQTGAEVRKVVGQHKVGLMVDPESFDRYGVTRVPSFVLTKAAVTPGPACAGKLCAPADGYALITGDVSLDYALEKIEQRAPAFKGIARDFLKKMRG